jgi:hypothetical protein
MGAGTASSGSYYSGMGGNGAGDGGYGMLLNNYGGGRASGGPTSGGTIYEVAENGRPELYQSGGRTYLLSGSDGHVIPASSGTSARANTAGSPEVKVVIENHTDIKPEVKQSTGSNGESIITVLMKHVDDRMTKNASNPSSNFGRALQGTYGLQRRGIPVGA